MKYLFCKKNLLFIVFIIFFSLTSSALADSSVQLDTILTDKLSEDTPPTESKNVFNPDTKMIYVFWKSDQLKEGQALRSVWIADDTSNVVPPNYKIDEATFNLNKNFKEKMLDILPGNYWHGNFSISKPNSGWPIGKYHVDIYLDGKLIKSIPFTIVKETVNHSSDKQKQWGAISIDAVAGDTDPAYGYGVADTKDEAEKIAQSFCEKADGKNCKLKVDYQECGAYAVSKQTDGIGTGDTKQAASDEALKNCKSNDCKIVIADCNDSN